MAKILSEEKLKNLIRSALKEALSLEFMKLRADLLPFVSEKEQKDIENLYGKPSRKVVKRIKIKV